MNKRERFQAFLNNEPADRAPAAFFHHYTTAQEYVTGLKEPRFFEKNVAGHLVSRKQDDPDILKIMNDVLMLMPVDCSMVKEARDLKDIIPPDMDSLYVQKTRELTERVLKYWEGEDLPVFATGFSPLFVLEYALKYADSQHVSHLAEYAAADPEAFTIALEKIEDITVKIFRMLMDDYHLDGIYFSVNNQNHLLPDETYRELVTPVEKRILMAINDKGTSILHICGYGGLTNNVHLYEDYDASAINWAVHAEGVSLREGKELFHGKPVMGGFAQDTIIYKGTEEEIKAEVKRILDDAGQVGVMIGADCTVPNDIDEKHFAWVREACEEYAGGHSEEAV